MSGIGGVGGFGEVAARMAAIQARIDGLTGAGAAPPPVLRVPGAAVAGSTATPTSAAPVRPTSTELPAEVAARPPSASTPGGALAAAPAGQGPPPATSTPQVTFGGSSGAASSAPVAAPSAAAPSVAPPAAATSPDAAALAAKLPEHGRRWAGAIHEAATAAGIEPALLAALVRHESNFRHEVRSHAGAMGLAQLMPGTARGLGVDPTDPHQNLAGGARYLRTQLDRFGSVELALAAYNAGPNRVAQAGGIPRIAETQAYVPRVVSTWMQLR